MKQLYFTALLLLSNIALAVTPENGWWWNPAEPGRGFNVEVQRDTVFIATFVYGEGGNPIWYSGSEKLQNSQVTVKLMRSDGGQCIGCPYTAPSSSNGAGVATFTFTSAFKGILTWKGGTTRFSGLILDMARG